MRDHKERYIDSLFIAFDEMGFAPTTVCPDAEKYAIEWREKIRAEFERLEIENASLRERLDKAVELPMIYEYITYPFFEETYTETVFYVVNKENERIITINCGKIEKSQKPASRS